MATIKKPSKALLKDKPCNDSNKIQASLNNGAYLWANHIGNKLEYSVMFPVTGGYFTITKSMYNKFNK